LAGDLEDETSEIARVVAQQETTVRKPEQNTRPNVFYVDGFDLALNPAAMQDHSTAMLFSDVLDPHTGHVAPGYVDAAAPVQFSNVRAAEQMVSVAYNAQHRVPWHWQVPAYLITKGMGAGVFGLLAVLALTGRWVEHSMAAVGGLGLLMTALTTALLVADLEHPLRFLRILVRPQWRSWLTRGAFILVGFTTVSGLWWLAELMGLASTTRTLFAAITLLGAVGTANYTALLFAQCEGRDLWQSPWLLVQLVFEAVALGGAGICVLGVWVPVPEQMLSIGAAALLWGLVAHAVGMGIEFGPPAKTTTGESARIALLYGRWRTLFWGGGVVGGHLLPLALLLLIPSATPIASLFAIIGLYCVQHAFVMAAHDVPNS
jgi:formate-dependent nitrite reductase membrane component NrfD